MRALLTFDTTHHALWAEEVLQESGFACDVVPAPAAAAARCNLAIEVLPEDWSRAADTLRTAGVPFATFQAD
jgi:hypothetical protein